MGLASAARVKRPAAGQRQDRALQRHRRHRICFSQQCAAAAEVPTRYRFCGHTVRVHQAIRLQQLAVLVCQLPASAVGALILEEGASWEVMGGPGRVRLGNVRRVMPEPPASLPPRKTPPYKHTLRSQ